MQHGKAITRPVTAICRPGICAHVAFRRRTAPTSCLERGPNWANHLYLMLYGSGTIVDMTTTRLAVVLICLGYHNGLLYDSWYSSGLEVFIRKDHCNFCSSSICSLMLLRKGLHFACRIDAVLSTRAMGLVVRVPYPPAGRYADLTSAVRSLKLGRVGMPQLSG